MRVIYIAGKYRDNRGEWFVRENIREAEKAAQIVWQAGGVALCPHKNTAFFGGLPGCPDEVWLKGDLELLRRCDAIWAIENWQDSAGARQEMEFARANSIPRLFCNQEVINYLRLPDNVLLSGKKNRKPDWWPECPYPEEVFPMKRERYAEIVPDPDLRTALSGCLGREFWNIASEMIWKSFCEAIEDAVDDFPRCPECEEYLHVTTDGSRMCMNEQCANRGR